METAEKIYRASSDERAGLLVRTNGGSVSVEASEPGQDDWVLTDTVAADGASPVNAMRLDLRITPTGGAEFYFDRGR